MSLRRIYSTTIAIQVLFLVLANDQFAHAATVNWVTWNSPETVGEAPGPCGEPLWCSGVPPVGEATGKSSDVTVTYSGEVDSTSPTYALNTFTPTSAFEGGTVSDAPTNNTFVLLSGGPKTVVNTIYFSAPVHDPVLAIAQLGQFDGRNLASGGGRITQQFDFIGDPSFAIEADGDNLLGNAGPLTKVGEDVVAEGGEGVIQFFGDYSSISWEVPVFKFYTFITVGDEGLAKDSTASVPEPSTWTMLLLGFAGLGFVGYRQTRRAKPQVRHEGSSRWTNARHAPVRLIGQEGESF
jgi:PEP-CTERM motif